MATLPVDNCLVASTTVRLPCLRMITATNCDSGLVVWLNPSIRWILRDGADGRGDMGGPIQKGIVQYSVSSNAQVNPEQSAIELNTRLWLIHSVRLLE